VAAGLLDETIGLQLSEIGVNSASRHIRCGSLVRTLLIGVHLVYSGISAVCTRGVPPNVTRCTAKSYEVYDGIYAGFRRDAAGLQRLKAKLGDFRLTAHSM
jgi:hypothetical protein